MAANFNPYQSIYAKQHGFDGAESGEYSSQSGQASSNPGANSSANSNATHYPYAHHSNQINAIDPIETTPSIPSSHDYHHHHMDLVGLSANQVNQAFNNMAFNSSFGDLSARSSRRSNDMFSMGHLNQLNHHHHHHQQHPGHDLAAHSSHFAPNHVHHPNGGHDEEYAFDVNQISDLLNDNDYFPNMCVFFPFVPSRLRLAFNWFISLSKFRSHNSRPISKSEILSDLKSTIAPIQSNLLSSSTSSHHQFEIPLSDSVMSAETNHHRDSNATKWVHVTFNFIHISEKCDSGVTCLPLCFIAFSKAATCHLNQIRTQPSTHLTTASQTARQFNGLTQMASTISTAASMPSECSSSPPPNKTEYSEILLDFLLFFFLLCFMKKKQKTCAWIVPILILLNPLYTAQEAIYEKFRAYGKQRFPVRQLEP